MRVIRCDICGKEFDVCFGKINNNIHQEYLHNGKLFDICVDCLPKYRNFQNELTNEYRKLEIEYENKRGELEKNIVQKYNIKDS